MINTENGTIGDSKEYVGPSSGAGFVADQHQIGPVLDCIGWCSGQASADGLNASASRGGEGEVTVNLDDRTAYPLLPSPDIDITMTIIIKKNGDISYSGNVTRFPRITLYEKREGGQWQEVFHTNPWELPFYYRTPLFLLLKQPIETVTHRFLK